MLKFLCDGQGADWWAILYMDRSCDRIIQFWVYGEQGSR